jgi:hypothetical protein
MGAFLGGKYFKMAWAEMAQMQQSNYFPNHSEPKKRGHVNYLELFTVYWALAKWKRELAGHLVVLHIGSMVALYCLESMSSKTLVFVALLRVIAKILMKHDIRLKPTYISSTANVIADCLSRGGVGLASLLKKWYQQLPSLTETLRIGCYTPCTSEAWTKNSDQYPLPRVQTSTAVTLTHTVFGRPLTAAWTTYGTTCLCGATHHSP